MTTVLAWATKPITAPAWVLLAAALVAFIIGAIAS